MPNQMAKKSKFYTSLQAAVDSNRPGHVVLAAVSHQMPDPVADLTSYLVEWQIHAKPPSYRILLDASKMITGYPSMFACMVRDPAGTIYVGEDDGFIRCRGGKAEVFVQDASHGIVHCSYARGIDAVVFGCHRGYVVHVDGPAISATRIVTSKMRIKDEQTEVSAIHGVGDDFMVAVGIRGLVSCHRGGQWTAVRPPEDVWFKAVWCRSKTEIYVGGRQGSIWRWDGASRWTRLKAEVPFDQDAITFRDLAAFQGTLYAACVEYGVFWLDGDLWRPIGQQKDEDVSRLAVTRCGLIGLGALWGTAGSWLTAFDGNTWTVEQVHISPQ